MGGPYFQIIILKNNYNGPNSKGGLNFQENLWYQCFSLCFQMSIPVFRVGTEHG